MLASSDHLTESIEMSPLEIDVDADPKRKVEQDESRRCLISDDRSDAVFEIVSSKRKEQIMDVRIDERRLCFEQVRQDFVGRIPFGVFAVSPAFFDVFVEQAKRFDELLRRSSYLDEPQNDGNAASFPDRDVNALGLDDRRVAFYFSKPSAAVLARIHGRIENVSTILARAWGIVARDVFYDVERRETKVKLLLGNRSASLFLGSIS